MSLAPATVITGSWTDKMQHCPIKAHLGTASLPRWACVVLIFAAVSVAQDVKRPPRIDHRQAREVVVIKAGEPARLTCPIIADTHLIVQWSKDGETVDDTWPAFRITSRTLKVKAATESLSGVYQCRGISGYGTAQHEIKLIVLDPDRQSYGGSSDSDVNVSRFSSLKAANHKLTPPKIIMVYPSQRKVTKLVGGRVRFKCVTVGFPKPTIKWYKNGAPLSVNRPADHSSPGQIVLTHLQLTDAATYQCKVTSVLGQDSAQFHLRVDDPLQRPPKIFGAKIIERSVRTGLALVLSCRVKAIAPTHIKWLKRLPKFYQTPLDGAQSAVTSQVLDHRQYSVLNTSEPDTVGTDLFASRLVLDPADVTDTGHYVCLAANTGGLAVKHMNVTVIPRPHGVAGRFDGMLGGSVYLILLVPLTAVIVLVCAAIASLYGRRRPVKCNSENKSDAEASLVGTDQVFLHLASSSENQSSTGTVVSSAGTPVVFSLENSNRCRYGRFDQRLTLAETEHTYNRLSGASCSESCCSSVGIDYGRQTRGQNTPGASQYKQLYWTDNEPVQRHYFY